MELIRNTIEISLERPVKVLHITDHHIALCDERDSDRKKELADRRFDPNAVPSFEEQVEYGKANCDLIVHTGDLIDFTSEANFDFARKALSDESLFFISGNHEFSHYLGEAYEDRTYKLNSFRQMGMGLGVPMFFNSRIVGGLNFVGIDNSYHQFELWQKAKLEKEIEKGLPIVLAVHAPLFEQSLYDHHIALRGEGSTYLVGCDEDHLPDDEWRAIEIRPTRETLETVEFIKSQPLIKCILAGHLHFSFESLLAENLPQLVTDVGTNGLAREVTFI